MSFALVALPLLTLAAYGHWLKTRIATPLEVPISLNPGHIRPEEFKINLRGRYLIEINVDDRFTYQHPECPIYGDKSLLKTHVKLFRHGVQLGETDGAHFFFIADFTADRSGRYALDIQVMPGASCLNAAHPTLTVVSTELVHYDDLYEHALWVAGIPIVAGFGLFGYSIFATLNAGQTEQPPPISRGSFGTSPFIFHGAKPVSALPQFGLYCGIVLMFVVFAMMITTVPMVPKGISVSLINPALRLTSASTAVVVRVTDLGPWTPAGVSINGKKVAWDRLSGELKDELKTRPNWFVYVEADDNVPWQSAANAIDVAKGLQARVILLTPGTRKQLTAN